MRRLGKWGPPAEALPLKPQLHHPCFRYEKAQAGRYREFHQFVELLGAPRAWLPIVGKVIGLVQEDWIPWEWSRSGLFINSIGSCRPSSQRH